jgi:hypothetical protein
MGDGRTLVVGYGRDKTPRNGKLLMMPQIDKDRSPSIKIQVLADLPAIVKTNVESGTSTVNNDADPAVGAVCAGAPV